MAIDDELDGVSEVQLRLALSEVARQPAPLNAQQMVQAEAQTWAKEWQVDQQYQPIGWGDDVCHGRPRLTAQPFIWP